ncbi:hypothetical protein AMS68_005326 [Peltaster fructicola]|uniref:FAD-binding domain-containing protein n=1 Tax=Peltaster fructicola TaxID=286661 RepID=A0A6H0XYX4_9PEZI|nr:hypothetical protein AMS68_005326 [Peltaster fructicola]
MPNTIDGVQRYPQLGIKVVIVGAGVAGLMSALECWRKGCDVVVIERAPEISPLGDFFTIPPSGMSTFKYYPAMLEDYHQEIYDCSISIWSTDGKCVMKTKPDWTKHREESAAPDVSISFIKRRPVFTTMLYNQCIRLGIPVVFSQHARSIEETSDAVVVTTADGTHYHGDLCIAADGIGSSLTKNLTGHEEAVKDSGYAAARAAFPRSAIKPGSPAASLLAKVEEEAEFRTYLGDDLHLILMLTKDYSDGHAAESWHNLREPSVFIEQLEQKTKGWDAAVIDFIRQIPTKVVDWGLRWRNPSEQWTSLGGRVLKAGDSAHAYLPTAGNGAVQALESAISIAECLRLGGKDGVPWSTKVHNHLRFQRTSILQQAGFNNRDELHHADLEAISKSRELSDIGFFKQGGWSWKHRPETYATQNYDQCLSHLRDGAAFVNTNLPPGHLYQPWSMESEDERMASKTASDLKKNGYWGV